MHRNSGSLEPADVAWWRALLRDGFPVTDLPLDRAAGALHSPLADGCERALGPAAVAALRPASGATGPRPEVLLATAASLLFARLAGEATLGFGLDGWPLRVDLDESASVAEALRSLNARLEERAAHCAGTPAELAAALGDAFASAAATMRVAVVTGGDGADLVEETAAGAADFVLALRRADAGVALGARFRGESLDRTTVEAWLESLEAIIEAFARGPQDTLGSIGLCSGPQLQRLQALQPAATPYPRDAAAHELFEEQVQRSPDRVATSDASCSWTYAALERRANAYAQVLRARGVGRGSLVGISLHRGTEMVAALLGALKAGAGYVPLDPEFPADRLAFMATDARLAAIVSQSDVADRFAAQSERLLLVDRDRAVLEAAPTTRLPRDERSATALDDCFVVYTSGSTGKPKGVRVHHRSAVNFLVSIRSEPGISAEDVVVAVTTLSFDMHFYELMLPLIVGARTIVATRDEARDGRALRTLLESSGATFLQTTPATWRMLVESGWQGHDRFTLVSAGEPLPPDLAAQMCRRAHSVWNGYGPSETGYATFWRVTAPERGIYIGHPLANSTVWVLDRQGHPCPVGVRGEICIGGDCVTLGYIARPELTAERFVPDPFSKQHGARLYRTGDRGRWCANGELETSGRFDHQVKIRGYRIELGEIEAALMAQPGVSRAVAIVREDVPGDPRLVAYVVFRGSPVAEADLRATLGTTLPAYMVPANIVALDEIPLLPNKKTNRLALPAPARTRPDLGQRYEEPRGDVERRICRVLAETLAIDRVGRSDNFFELGGSSLLVMRALARLQSEGFGSLSATAFFRDPTAAALARAASGEKTASAGTAARPRSIPAAAGAEPIAIVGMAGRFPGAADVESLWRNLLEGRESVTYFDAAQIDPLVPAGESGDPAYVRARGILDDIESFDAGFFGIGTREAELTDPQQRIFLELCWEVLERAGHVPEKYDGRIGVFAGMYHSGYFARNLQPNSELVRRYGEFNVTLLNEKDYLATRAAYKLGLTGPAISLYTACSTSLVAMSQAFDSLRGGQCDMAIAGGVAITYPYRSGYLYQEGAMLSPDGHTRSFDAQAQGTVFSDGAAVVLLKRLSDAIADRNPIYALVKGVALNNDGARKASFTAPSADGQARVVADAQRVAGVDPRSVSYIEAHGTATPIGDPIEIEGLTEAFRQGTTDNGFCGIGSIKSNVGHLLMAAGAAGVIKTALALQHERIPPSINVESPNPRVGFESTPFHVVTRTTPWPRGPAPRRAGVSSFGVGGTNAHVVLEEAPEPRDARPVTGEGPCLLQLSARSAAALDAAAARLADHLEASPGERLADVAFTLRAGRRDFAHRATLVATTPAEAAQILRERGPRFVRRELGASAPAVVFMFPGQGSQYVRMGLAFYAADATFRQAFDECALALQQGESPIDLPRILQHADDAALAATAITQRATFAVEYALARTWLAFGVRPAALVGHSIGEFVAAVLAGVMSVGDAVRLVAYRGRLMQALPPGAMLSVRAPGADVERRLPPELAIAAYNSPVSVVVSGPETAVDAFRAALERDGIAARRLHTSHAFHSPMMDAAVPDFEAALRRVALSAPQLPIVSTVTGRPLSPGEATDPRYWARQLREPVRFSQALDALATQGERVWLEVGPRTALSTLARQQFARRPPVPPVVATLADAPESEVASLYAAAGALWTVGTDVDTTLLDAPDARRVRLPTYPFQRQKYWIDPPAAAPTRAVTVDSPAIAETEMNAMPQPSTNDRRPRLLERLYDLIEEVSGEDLRGSSAASSFVELGLDSLAMTQVALQLQKAFGVKVTFRQLMEACGSPAALVAYLDGAMPADSTPVAAAAIPSMPAAAATVGPAPVAAATASGVVGTALPPAVPAAVAPAPPAAMGPAAQSLQALIQMQVELMRQQLALLGGAVATSPAAATAPGTPMAAVVAAASVSSAAPTPAAAADTVPLPQAVAGRDDAAAGDAPTGPVKYDVKTAFGAIARIHTSQGFELTPQQRARLDAFVRRYVARTAKSKAYTTEHRAALADPRVVNGFRPLTKEITYQIVTDRSKGSRVWDIDGNEYVDALNGFGTSLFGWQPDFVLEAVRQQVERGYEIGPMHPLAGEVARLVCELTGNDRAALCNTGSEAVMGAMRIARTVTGRSKIAIFNGAYHGIFDEVIVRGTKKLRAVPAAPGILPNTAENVLVLDYGTEESLRILRERGEELAAIMVEPVQSRRPDFQPREFLHALRDITTKAGSVYIFDEVITGFRCHPGGAQAHFGVRADLATYGKVPGGGFPIGMISGKREFMDALDGGHWQFGDDSIPTVGVTYFAGTFVRHPLTLAAAKASLEHMKKEGPALQQRLNDRVSSYAAEMNAFFRDVGAPLEIRHFASLWRTTFLEDHPMQDLVFAMLRSRGVHILDNFPCFFTTAHSEADFQFITQAYKESVREMQACEFLPRKAAEVTAFDANRPPIPGARLGRDKDGTPAWFVPDPSVQGKYRKLAS